MTIKYFVLLCLLSLSIATFAQDFDPEKAEKDFNFLWLELDQKYAYFDQKQTDWARVKEIYLAKLHRIHSKYHFILLLEKVLAELYDSHTHLNVNTEQSMRVIPSGTDIWGELLNTKYVITAVRKGAPAEALLRPGDQVTKFGKVPIKVAIKEYIGASIAEPGPEAKSWAFRILLAGDYKKERRLTVRRDGIERDVKLGVAPYPESRGPGAPLLNRRMLTDRIAYLRVENTLGDSRLVTAFGDTVDSLSSTSGLILDLRNTPSGGNTLVGRAILGKFVDQDHFYQKHELPGEERHFGVKRSWAEIVSPVGETYRQPIVVLVNQWTGSMGEGIAVAFDALERATVVGNRMAGLNGAVYNFVLPFSGYRVSYSAEKLYHMNGTPREHYRPTIDVDLSQQLPGDDLILEEGLRELQRLIDKKGN